MSSTEATDLLATLVNLLPTSTVVVELEVAAPSRLKGGVMVMVGRVVERLGREEERVVGAAWGEGGTMGVEWNLRRWEGGGGRR